MQRKPWFRIGRLIVLVYLGMILMLMLLERFLVYPAPAPDQGDWTAADFGAEDVLFASADGTPLHGWYFAQSNPRAHVLFCHGNGEHVGYSGSEVQAYAKRFNVSVFVFDYRGYGKSEGKPFEAGVLEDAEAAQKWLASQSGLSVSDIVIHGRSLGGAVAVHLAQRLGARALILERTFHSMVEIGAAQYPWIPVRWVMRNRYPSAERITSYQGPLLQLHGAIDTLVPLESAKQLYDACPSAKKSFLLADQMGHNGPAPESFRTALHELFKSI